MGADETFRVELNRLHNDKRLRFAKIDGAAGTSDGYTARFAKAPINSAPLRMLAATALDQSMHTDDLVLPPATRRGRPGNENLPPRPAGIIGKPDPRDVRDAVLAAGSKLTGSEAFWPFLELFLRPDLRQMILRPEVIGRKSFLAEESGVYTPEGFDLIFAQMDPDDMAQVAQSHIDCLDGKPMDIVERRASLYVPPVYFGTATFERLLMPIEFEGEQFAMIYSRRVAIYTRVRKQHEYPREGSPLLLTCRALDLASG